MPELKIPLSDLDFGSEEEEAVLRVLRSKWLSMGEETQAFEQEFAETMKVKHAIAVSSGTAALHLALLSTGIGPGDIVLQPALNFVSAANMTRSVGATPIFADICSLKEPTISPDITTKAQALIVMHYGGYPCRMEELEQICKERNMILIEDACHGVGGTDLLGRPMGSIGDAGCFSFFSNKNMATGEGGMITTNRDDIAEKCRLLRSHGMTSLTWDRHKGHASSYDVITSGFNYRIDEIRSALGRVQLRKLPENNAHRRKLTRKYWTCLAPLKEKGWIFPFENHSALHVHSSAHLLPVLAPNEDTRTHVIQRLREAGIQSSLHYPFILDFEAFEEVAENSCIKASTFSRCVITLPLYPGLSIEQSEFIGKCLG